MPRCDNATTARLPQKMQGQDLIEKSVKSSRQQKDDSTMIRE